MSLVDVLVVGGGPGGLAAASVAGRGGASVLLVDEWPELGGRLRYRRSDVRIGGAVVPAASLRAALVEQAVGAGVELSVGTVAWAAFAGAGGVEVSLSGGSGGMRAVSPARVILATGTTDRAAIVPGATCPGVLTARALQLLLTIHGVRPGRRFAILGEDRLDELVGDIEAAGGSVVRSIAIGDIPAVTIEGDEGVRAITVGGERVAVDIVVVAIGTLPDTQLAGMLGCPLDAGEAWPPRLRREASGSLGVAGVSLCGTAAGAGSIEASILDGALVGRGRGDEADDARLLASLALEGATR